MEQLIEENWKDMQELNNTVNQQDLVHILWCSPATEERILSTTKQNINQDEYISGASKTNAKRCKELEIIQCMVYQ